MTLTILAKQAEKFLTDRSPLILTAIGVTGTITTAYLTGKASYKAAQIIEAEEYKAHLNEPRHDLDARAKAELVWKLYIPAVTTGVLTVACIVSANQIGTRRAAAMAAAYKLSEKAYTEYREKIIEKIGENKERAARDDIAQDRVNRTPFVEREVIITGGGDVLCFEPYTGRYFHSDMETLKKAQNDLNYQVNNSYYASLSDFYDLIGLEHTTMSDDVGWNSDELLELSFSTVLSSDSRPCISVEYKVVPIRDYYRVQ